MIILYEFERVSNIGRVVSKSLIENIWKNLIHNFKRRRWSMIFAELPFPTVYQEIKMMRWKTYFIHYVWDVLTHVENVVKIEEKQRKKIVSDYKCCICEHQNCRHCGINLTCKTCKITTCENCIDSYENKDEVCDCIWKNWDHWKREWIIINLLLGVLWWIVSIIRNYRDRGRMTTCKNCIWFYENKDEVSDCYKKIESPKKRMNCY